MDVLTILSNFGLPAVCFGLAGYFCKHIYDKEREERRYAEDENRKERVALEERLESMTTAITENTISLKNLTEAVLKIVNVER